MSDSLAFCKRMVVEVGLGLAPGAAFRPEGEGFVRWYFAPDEARLADGVERLQRGAAAVDLTDVSARDAAAISRRAPAGRAPA